MADSPIKNGEMYTAARDESASNGNGARSSNGAAAQRRSRVSARGPRTGSYDSWTVVELKKRAKELGLTGYSGLPKDKLIDKLRSY